jgi:hypothetical protein
LSLKTDSNDLVIKITAMISWLGSQNQVGYDLSVTPQNWWEDEYSVGQTSRSSGLLCMEVSQVRVSQSDHKTGGCAV